MLSPQSYPPVNTSCNGRETVVRIKNRPKTSADYNPILDKRIVPALGKLPLIKLTSLHIQEFLVSQIAEGLTARSVIKAFTVLRSACNHAVKLRTLTFNPCDAVEIPKHEKFKAKVFELDQLQQLFTHMDQMILHLTVILGRPAACAGRM